MSHEFIITTAHAPGNAAEPLSALKAMQSVTHATFIGYHKAALYIAFDAEEFNGGVSGNFGGKTISKHSAGVGLCAALHMLESFPDPKRADSLREFYQKTVLQASDDAVFYIHFY